MTDDDKELHKDAERYRWLRAQHWSESALVVISDPKQNLRLGVYCPSGDLLDEAIDAAMLKTPNVKVTGCPKGSPGEP